MLLITDLGRAAITDASSKGLKVSISGFAVGDGKNYVPVSNMTGLYGNQLYPIPGSQASVTNVEAISDTSLQFTCEVPSSIPDAGEEFVISELGLYTDGGTLFAIGLVEPSFTKHNGVIYRAISNLSVTACEDYRVDINTHMSLPYIAHITNLDSPVNTIENAIIVGDGQTNARNESETSSVIAIKYGGATDIKEWAFTSHTRILHKVNPIILSDRTKFKVADTTDMWFYDQEVVLVQVVVGSSVGQTRKFRYNSSASSCDSSQNGCFNLIGTDEFYDFSNIDKINVWRQNSNQLPPIKNVVEGKTLQIAGGVPAWGTAGGSYDLSQFRYPLKVVRHLFVGNEEKRVFALPNSACFSMVGISGAMQAQDSYTIVGNNLVFIDPPCAGTHEALLFVADTNRSNTGASVEVKGEQYVVGVTGVPGYNATNEILMLSDGPSNADDLLVFHAHSFLTQNEYVYDPVNKSITFPSPRIDGITEVRWAVFSETVDGSIVTVVKSGFVGDGTADYELPHSILECNSFVFTQGGYHETGTYSITENSIDIGTTFVGRKSEVLGFVTEQPNISNLLLRNDPNIPSLNQNICKLKDGDFQTVNGVLQVYINHMWRTISEEQKPHVVYHEGDGITISFDIEVVPRNKADAVVNVGGTVLMLSQFSISGTTLTLVLDDPPPIGRNIEIIVRSYWVF